LFLQGEKIMDRNILLGAAISTIILILLASYSNVVGYHAFTSHPLNESPLFTIRKQNAINLNEENRIISDYIGKGENNSIMISKRNDNLEKVRDVIYRIKLMDDNTFKIFVKTVFYKLSQQGKNHDLESDEIINELYHLRSTSKIIERKNLYADDDRTWLATPTFCWFPGCILLTGIGISLLVIFIIIIFIDMGPTAIFTCYPCPT
jgi:hypothetical protein